LRKQSSRARWRLRYRRWPRADQPGRCGIRQLRTVHYPNKDTPIYTLCRTGVRSVGASNLLTDAGYTHVRNIWEGFVGIHLTALKRQEDGSTKVEVVDLNHDGNIDDRDKNGWRYHYGLPYVTRLLPQLIYKDMAYLYDWD
jgi:rhodanese-related sulfurtransferase